MQGEVKYDNSKQPNMNLKKKKPNINTRRSQIRIQV